MSAGVSRVYKYPIKLTSEQDVSLPVGAKILTVQLQGEQLCLWAIIDPQAEIEPKRIYIFGTGQPMPYFSFKYIGTIQMRGGEFVWHIFTL